MKRSEYAANQALAASIITREPRVSKRRAPRRDNARDTSAAGGLAFAFLFFCCFFPFFL